MEWRLDDESPIFAALVKDENWGMVVDSTGLTYFFQYLSEVSDYTKRMWQETGA